VDSLTPALSAALPLPVKSGSALGDVQLPRPVQTAGNGIGDGLLPAIGAAIGGEETTLPALDLSRQLDRVRAGKRAPAVLLAGMAGSTLWMIAAAFASITLTVLENQVRSEDGHIRAATERLRAEREPLLKRAAINTAARALEAKVRVPASAVLGRVAAATPTGIAVKRLTVGADGKMTLEGDAVNTATMENFASNLGKSVAIKVPTYDIIHQDDKGGLSFKIVGITRTAAPAAAANPNAE
jgi:Tfp pilus assembly protein PilN